ncbi:MAG: ketopantoate reductase family protein, partial [Acetobacteraceae bacterium]|nr:ketopantoate reductase family protein [Acetobacteraceae bacterium]
GGLAKIQATLAPDGTVRHLNDWRWLAFGEPDGSMSPRVRAMAALAGRAEGVIAEAVPDILHRMWEKLVHLGTSAIGTVLLRANTGEIARSPGGVAFMHRLLERNAAIAAANGHAMRPEYIAEFRALFADPKGMYATSMLRDLEAGGRIEADHILGFLLDAARRAGVPEEAHEAAYIHAKAFEQRRDAGRLPGRA